MKTILLISIFFFATFFLNTSVLNAYELTDIEKKNIESLLHNFLQCTPKEASLNDYTFNNPRAACNIAVTEALHYIYDNSEMKKNELDIYRSANAINSYLEKNPEWASIGTAKDKVSLYKAQCLANNGYQVIAVSKEMPHGHVALVLPGQVIYSGKLRKYYPNMFSFFLDKFDKTMIGRGMNWVWKECDIHKVNLYFRTSIYNYFKSLPINNCDEIPDSYMEESKAKMNIKIKKISSELGESISGYVSIKKDQILDRISMTNKSYKSNPIFSSNVSFTREDPNIACWSISNIEYKPGDNYLTFTAYSGNETSEVTTVIKYPQSYFDYIETQEGRRLASVSNNGSEPRGIYFDKIEFLSKSEIKVSGHFRDYNEYYNTSQFSWESNCNSRNWNISIDRAENFCKYWSIPSIKISDFEDQITILVENRYGKEVFEYLSIYSGQSLAPPGETSPQPPKNLSIISEMFNKLFK